MRYFTVSHGFQRKVRPRSENGRYDVVAPRGVHGTATENFFALNVLARKLFFRGTSTRSLWEPYQSKEPVKRYLPLRLVRVLSIVCQPSAHFTWRATLRRGPEALPLMA